MRRNDREIKDRAEILAVILDDGKIQRPRDGETTA